VGTQIIRQKKASHSSFFLFHAHSLNLPSPTPCHRQKHLPFSVPMLRSPFSGSGCTGGQYSNAETGTGPYPVSNKNSIICAICILYTTAKIMSIRIIHGTTVFAHPEKGFFCQIMVLTTDQDAFETQVHLWFTVTTYTVYVNE
jgi:hypothetical protein